MQLVRDLLDKQVVDRNGRRMGRVDRVVLARGHGSPPRVVAIEIGPTALAARLGHRLGRATVRVLTGVGLATKQPLRVHVSAILGVTETVKVDLAFGATSAAATERALRSAVARIPGARR